MRGASGLEARLSSFIGREKELAELRRLASSSRLLTLLGPGGCGKTRLATEYARQQSVRFPDGQILVELAVVHNSALVGDTIARAAGITPPVGDPVASLIGHLQHQQLMLVVDNCEHLIDAVAQAVARLLAGCPHLVVLVTSRERLNIEGEMVWRVPPMSMPESEASLAAAGDADAVRLLVDRARSLRPGFNLNERNRAAVVGIARGLDGMPLAIELAAARITTLSPTEIRARLDDRLGLLTTGPRNVDQRHRTLQAALDWSYDLLESRDRLLLQRLSVFAGAVRIDAVLDVCGSAPLDRDGVLDGLQRLADKSMLEAEADADEETRYRLLETVREYSTEKLAATGQDIDVHDRHLGFYRRLADDAYQARLKRGAMAEHRRLWAEMADVRAALEWAGRDPMVELELFGSLKLIWLIYAPGEGTQRFARIMPETPMAPTPAHLRALWAGSALRGRTGYRGRPLFTPDDFIELGQRLGDDVMVTVGHLGNAYMAERVEGDLAKARRHLGVAVAKLESLGDSCDLAMALCSLGSVEMQVGNLDTARPWLNRGLEVASHADDEYGMAGAYYTLGWLELLSGEMDSARTNFGAALALAGDGDLLSAADQIQGMASADAETDPQRAMRLFGAAQRIRDELETPLGAPWAFWVEPAMAKARGALPADAADAAWRFGREMSAAQAVAMVRERARATVGTAPPTVPGSAPAMGEGGTFRLEGEYWTVGFEGRALRLRDSKGLRVLACLLGDPERPFAALDLERLGAVRDEMTAHAVAAGDAGEFIDDAARDAYRARIAELRELIAEAENRGKPDTAGALSEELEFIMRELSRGLGLGGRPRRAGSIAERARLNVTRALKSAIRRVASADARLGAHLGATVHTGVVCVYTPDPRVHVGWEVSQGDVHQR